MSAVDEPATVFTQQKMMLHVYVVANRYPRYLSLCAALLSPSGLPDITNVIVVKREGEAEKDPVRDSIHITRMGRLPPFRRRTFCASQA